MAEVRGDKGRSTSPMLPSPTPTNQKSPQQLLFPAQHIPVLLVTSNSRARRVFTEEEGQQNPDLCRHPAGGASLRPLKLLGCRVSPSENSEAQQHQELQRLPVPPA